MTTRGRSCMPLLVTIGAVGLTLAAQQLTPGPVLFFTDLTSGPNKGGEDGNGAFVTVYGNFLGSSKGSSSITAGGGEMVNCKLWGSVWMSLPSGQNWIQKITCQLGPHAKSGDIVVTVDGVASNPLPFAVRPGNIYFVAANGNDSKSGDFHSPWATIPHAVQAAGAREGSIVYAMDGVTANRDDGQGWNAALTLRQGWCKGTEAAPTALIAYPGAKVTIGNGSGASPAFGVRSTDASGGACAGNWVFAGLNFRGIAPVLAAGPSDNWRWIGNDISNPAAAGSGGGGAAFSLQMTTHTKFLGNRAHDLNLAATDRLQQGIYPGTDSNHTEIGWNLIYNAKGRAGIQVHSSPVSSGTGFAMFDLSIHDNVVHDIAEECIIVDTVDPSKGPVRIFNNIVFNCGRDGKGNGAIYRTESSDFDSSHGAGAGVVEIFNNTIAEPYEGGGIQTWFEIHRGQPVVDQVRNNLIYAPSGGSYWNFWKSGQEGDWRACAKDDTPVSCPNLMGSNNLVFGTRASALGSILSSTIAADPKFLDAGKHDFHPGPNSPAISGGAAIGGLTHDIEGKPRRQDSPAIGALEPAAPGK